MMRVLCLTPWFPNTPGERQGNYIFDSVMGLREEGVEVKVMVVRPWKPWKREELNTTSFIDDLEIELVYNLSIPRNYLQDINNRLLYISLYERLLKYARKHKVDLIHALRMWQVLPSL